MVPRVDSTHQQQQEATSLLCVQVVDSNKVQREDRRLILGSNDTITATSLLRNCTEV